MSPSPLLVTRLFAGHVRRLLALGVAAFLAGLPPRLLGLLLLRRRAPSEPAAIVGHLSPADLAALLPTGGPGWSWSTEVRTVVVDGIVEAVVPCRVLRRPGSVPFVIPLSRRKPMPAGYRPSVN